MKENNFYTVMGWMVNNLKLRGNELICYAVIYSFSQDEETKYMGGVKYLCRWMNASEPTVISVLDKLMSKGLIEPTPVITDKCKRVYYNVTKESLERGYLRNLSKVTKESLVSLYNNNNNNITLNKKVEDNTSTKKSFRKPTVEQIDEYIKEKKLHFNAERFFDYYESKGWVVGKNSPMKDWKAACRTWESMRNGKQEHNAEPAVDLPDGLTRDQWTKIVLFLCREVGRIAAKITPEVFVQMKSLAENDSHLVMFLLKQINEKAEMNSNIDVVEEYKTLVKNFKA